MLVLRNVVVHKTFTYPPRVIVNKFLNKSISLGIALLCLVFGNPCCDFPFTPLFFVPLFLS